MYEEPLVSVILPTYNRGKELGKTVESVLNQTYENLELIVVDDCSEMPAEKHLEPVEDNRLKILRHEENKNASAARNTGIKQSKGDLIALLDDDDLWKPNKLEEQIKMLRKKGRSFRACYTGAEVFSDYGRRRLTPRRKGDITRSILLTRSNGSYGSTLLVDREIVDEINGFDEEFDRHQDLEFLLRVLEKTNICCLSKPLIERDMTDYLQDTETMLDSKKQFLSKFEEKIRNQGLIMSRKIYSTHYISLSKTAILNKDYKIGFKYYLKSLVKYPILKPKEIARPPYYFSKMVYNSVT